MCYEGEDRTGNEDKDGEQEEIKEEGGETDREKEEGGGGFYCYSQFVLLSALQSRFQHHLTTRLSDGKKGSGCMDACQTGPCTCRLGH